LPPLTGSLKQWHDDGRHILYVLNSSADRLTEPSEVISALPNHPLGLTIDEWQDVRFFAHQNITLSDNQIALLETNFANPVVIENQSKATANGLSTRVLWLNAALNGADNVLPVSPVFVPFLRAVVDYFARADAYPHQLTVGEGVRLKKSVQMLDPDGEPILNLSELSKPGTQIVTRPGNYTVLESNADIPVQVVVDLAESDLRRASFTELVRWKKGGVVSNSAQNDDSIAQAQTTSDPSSQMQPEEAASSASKTGMFVSLTRWIVPACLLILLLETFYANRHLSTRRSS